MAKPEEIELSGNTRYENSNSPLGKIYLRWPRKAELLFGRTPQRAMNEAAQAVSRGLKRNGFPPRLARLNLDWKVVFLDENLPEKQIPAYLISNCHPGWMTPPANIYIVAQRVAAGCSGKTNIKVSDSDALLARTIIHEMGHAVEYQLIPNQFGSDRMRAEGFASWFEQYASNFAPVIKKNSVRDYYYELARLSFQQSGSVFVFRGSAYDYARASLYFAAVAGKRRVPGVMKVYKFIGEGNYTLFPAIEKSLGWNRSRLEQEVRKLVD